MTPENFKYRTSPLFLRNQFDSNQPWSMPVIPKYDASLINDVDLRLIGFNQVKNGKDEHFKRMVHFFLYDYNFEDIWKNPEPYVKTLKKYKAVLSPDFSMYIEMNPVMQLYNTFRNRWVGAYLASVGIKVVPTVSWGLENTFDFCFNGIEKGSVVAVSTYMVSEHGNHSDQKDFFMAGYNEMMKRIEPELVICYHHPFPEMTGNILYIDYELSSWHHYSDDLSKSYIKITNPLNSHNNKNKIKYFYGSVLPYTQKGSGSAFGGEWKPKKPEAERFLGKPGEIKRTLIPGKHGGYYVDTKIGDDGRAIKERHYTDHLYPNKHSNPHDHPVNWSKGVPEPDSKNRINYFDGKIPEFKSYKEASTMINYIPYDPERNRFKTISEFKWCMECGGEVEIIWKGKSYSITHPDGVINIGEGYYIDENGVARNVESNEPCVDIEGMNAETADGILEYVIDGDKLRDIITKVEVSSRTI